MQTGDAGFDVAGLRAATGLAAVQGVAGFAAVGLRAATGLAASHSHSNSTVPVLKQSRFQTQ